MQDGAIGLRANPNPNPNPPFTLYQATAGELHPVNPSLEADMTSLWYLPAAPFARLHFPLVPPAGRLPPTTPTRIPSSHSYTYTLCCPLRYLHEPGVLANLAGRFAKVRRYAHSSKSPGA